MILLREQLSLLRDWKPFFEKEMNQEYFKSLETFLEKEFKASAKIYPPKPLIFNSFFQTQLKDVKVVIMGQDPYHGCGQAHGLSFSVSQGVPPPPSLRNIFKELENDLQIKRPQHGCLLSWAQQGVLLLNATLTVKEQTPKSHYGQGWEVFTDHVIEELVRKDQPLVFLLWGKSAQEKCLRILDKEKTLKHLVLETTHPSPFSAHYGFLGSRHFSKANQFLKNQGLTPINWDVN